MTREYTKDTYRSHVQKGKKYDINELMRDNIFYWVTSRTIYNRIIKRDKETLNILKAETIGTGKGKRYVILSKNIINFYKVYGPGINLLKNND